jgi:hypothetical protein
MCRIPRSKRRTGGMEESRAGGGGGSIENEKWLLLDGFILQYKLWASGLQIFVFIYLV